MARVLATACLAAAAAAAAAPSCLSPSCSSGGGCPTDNPITAFFGGDAYEWTATIAWSTCVYSLADYPGPDLQARLDAAAAAAHACAGPTSPCVVYAPPGTYPLSATAGLHLPSYTVLRGSAPSSAAAKAGTAPGDLNPASLLVAPQLTLPSVGCVANASAGDGCASVGLVHVGVDGATVRVYGGPTSGFALVFGVRAVNVNFRYPGGPGTTGAFPWPYRFATAIVVSQSPNLLIANNLLPRSPLAFNTTVAFAGKGKAPGFNGSVPFPVDNRYGIAGGQPPGAATVNASIHGNYVFQNGRVGVQWASAPADLGAPPGTGGFAVVGNHVEVAANTTCYSVDGVSVATGSDTNENRGYDQSGPGGSLVANNTGHIHRQRAGTSGYDTVDGEGVLQQTQDGLTAVGNVWSGNDLSGGSSGYMNFYNIHNITGNVVTGNTVNADQTIGVADCRGCVVAGNVCAGNSQPCTGM
jgi:hypothetical protein